MSLLRLRVKQVIDITRARGPTAAGKEVIQYLSREPKSHIETLRERGNLTVAEIGVFKGDNAKFLLETLDIDQIYLIDPYEQYREGGSLRTGAERISEVRQIAHENLDGYDEVTWIEAGSDDAVAEIDAALDYVYVDGNHDYEYAKTDIENYYPRLAEDGIIAGDDLSKAGVARAFVEFATENNLRPHVETAYPEWYFVRGDEIG